LKKRNFSNQALALVGISAALALLLSYVEHLLPPLFAAVPGIKMGLPNVIVLYMLYAAGPREAGLVSLVRLLLSALLFGSAMTFLYSLAGAVLSFLVMVLLKKTEKLSPVGVSVAGAVCHNIGQVLMAMLLLDTPQIVYYLLVLTVTGTLAGILVGLLGGYLQKRLPLKMAP